MNQSLIQESSVRNRRHPTPVAAQFLQPVAITYPWVEDLNRQLYHPKGVVFYNGINSDYSVKVHTVEPASANSIDSDHVRFLVKST